MSPPAGAKKRRHGSVKTEDDHLITPGPPAGKKKRRQGNVKTEDDPLITPGPPAGKKNRRQGNVKTEDDPFITPRPPAGKKKRRQGSVNTEDDALITPGPPAGEKKRRQGSVKAEDDSLITLKITDLKGRRVFHTMKKSDRLKGAMDAYYKKATDVTYGTGHFVLGFELKGSKTPAEIDLDDGDEIDFFLPVMGS